MRTRSFLIVALAVLFGSAIYPALDSPTVYSSVVEDAVSRATSVPRPRPVATSTPSPLPAPQPSPAPVRAAVKQKPGPIPHATAPITGNSLSIPIIGFQAPIVDVGLTPSNAIDVPAGMQVGRYTGVARPGSLGAVFLDGHFGGIFAKLGKVEVGQIISANYDGQTYSYRVVYSEIVPLTGIDMAKALNVYGGGSEGLNLMTCAGIYVPSAGTYDHRLVVYSVRI